VDTSQVFWSELERLFTLVGQVDDNGRLVRASPLLARYVEADRDTGCQFFEAFKFKRPTPFDGSILAAQKAVGRLFLGFSDELGFAVRGQVVDYSRLGIDGLCFVGVPWLWWIEGNAPDKALTMSDFPAHDVQMDQLFFMSTQQSMVEDLQALNGELAAAREELERVNEARQKYFHHVSHEMRTPLNGVISSLSLMQGHPLDSKVQEYADLAAQSSQRLLEVINYTLETATLESHMAEAELESFQLEELLNECIGLATPNALKKNLQLHCVIEGNVSGLYCGRLKLLKQVLVNLMSNAVKFSHQGEITLGVKNMGEAPEGGEAFQFYVRDQGPGIPPDALPVLFDPFSTGLSEATRSSEGTGLGLSIVQRFVEKLGGQIQVSSTVGDGARFFFTVTLTYIGETAVTAVQSSTAAQAARPVTGHLLLVDDVHTNRLLNGKQLESLGFQVTTAASGKAALAQLQDPSERFDLVLMDLDMPEMDGFETTKLLKEVPALGAIPVVALTALSALSDRQRAEEVGMVGFLGKPFDREQALALLGTLLPSGSEDQSGLHDSQQGSFERDVHNQASSQDAEMAPSSTFSGDCVEVAETFSHPVIDDLVNEVGSPLAHTLVDKFLQESSERWETLRVAIAERHQDVVVRESHTLGSACLTFGLLAAGASFRQIEAAAIAGQLPEVEDLAPITQNLGVGIGALRTHLASKSE